MASINKKTSLLAGVLPSILLGTILGAVSLSSQASDEPSTNHGLKAVSISQRGPLGGGDEHKAPMGHVKSESGKAGGSDEMHQYYDLLYNQLELFACNGSSKHQEEELLVNLLTSETDSSECSNNLRIFKVIQSAPCSKISRLPTLFKQTKKSQLFWNEVAFSDSKPQGKAKSVEALKYTLTGSKASPCSVFHILPMSTLPVNLYYYDTAVRRIVIYIPQAPGNPPTIRSFTVKPDIRDAEAHQTGKISFLLNSRVNQVYVYMQNKHKRHVKSDPKVAAVKSNLAMCATFMFVEGFIEEHSKTLQAFALVQPLSEEQLNKIFTVTLNPHGVAGSITAAAAAMRQHYGNITYAILLTARMCLELLKSIDKNPHHHDAIKQRTANLIKQLGDFGFSSSLRNQKHELVMMDILSLVYLAQFAMEFPTHKCTVLTVKDGKMPEIDPSKTTIMYGFQNGTQVLQAERGPGLAELCGEMVGYSEF